MGKLKYYLLIVWELPQFLLGLLTGIFLSSRIISMNWIENVLIVRVKEFKGGISFGRVVFISTVSVYNTIKHEMGHSKQSAWLGPLYLLIIGIPSVIHSIIHTLFRRQWDYYGFYTEKWADKINNVER